MTDKTEMTEARAREILGAWRFDCLQKEMGGNGLIGFLYLQGKNYTADELEAIAWCMRNKA